MLFNCQRPCVSGQTRSVARQKGEIGQDPSHRQGPMKHGGKQDCGYKRVDVKRRIDLETSAQPERFQANTSESLVLLKQETRNQETADHEKKIDTAPSNFSKRFHDVG